MIKRVDIVPILLRDLPWHGLMRGSTEGGRDHITEIRYGSTKIRQEVEGGPNLILS